MKKIISLLLALTLMMSMSMTVFAGCSGSTPSSPSKSPVKVGSTDTAAVSKTAGKSSVEGIKVWDPVMVDGKASDVAVAVTPVVAAVATEAASVAAATAEPGSKVLDVFEVTVEIPKGSKATVGFNVAGVYAGQNIVALHKLANGTWETIIPDAVTDGKVVITMTSFSPVAFVEVAAAPVATAAPAVVSPKTMDMTPYVAVLAMIALCGAVVLGKKRA